MVPKKTLDQYYRERDIADQEAIKASIIQEDNMIPQKTLNEYYRERDIADKEAIRADIINKKMMVRSAISMQKLSWIFSVVLILSFLLPGKVQIANSVQLAIIGSIIAQSVGSHLIIAKNLFTPNHSIANKDKND